MAAILGFIAFLAVALFLVWLFSGSTAKANQPFDSTDSQQIGFLIGLSGGSIADAATARYALQRFEEIHNRKATARDLGTIIGLSKDFN